MTKHPDLFHAGFLSTLALALAACSEPGSDNPTTFGGITAVDETGGGESGSGPGATTSDPSGGPTTTAGTSSDPTSATTADDSGASQCSGPQMESIPIDDTGWVPRNCTPWGIQGAWYCYDDGINASSCVANTPPFRAGGMCISGNTTLDDTFQAWGAGIGLTLNETGGTGSVKTAYDATTNGVRGFEVTLEGSSGGNAIRIGFSGSATPGSDASPFVQVPGVGTYEVLIEDALVPMTWDVPNAGATANASSLFDLQVQVVGAENNAAYDVCITSLRPIGEPTSTTGTPADQPPPFGESRCGNNDEIFLTPNGPYWLRNNVWGAGHQGFSGGHCLQALWQSGSNVAGMVVTPNPQISVSSNEPASYPSIVYGWHYGQFRGAYTSARQISGITSVPSSWNLSAPAAGRYNASYDLWLHPQANPANPNGGLELMIWLDHREATPIGTHNQGVANLGGAQWEVWTGSVGSWQVISYRRVTGTESAELDLKQFIDHAVPITNAENNWYLLSVQSGFELWNMNQVVSTNAYSVSVN